MKFSSFIKLTSAMALGAALTGCGTGIINTEGNFTRGLVKEIATNAQARRAGTPKGIDGATASQIKAPAIQVKIANIGFVGVAVKTETSKDVDVYRTSSGQAFYMRGGNLIGTRGMMNDLMSRSLGETQNFRYLTSQNTTAILSAKCEKSGAGRETIEIAGKSYSTRVTDEICRAQSSAFKNKYWTNANGSPRKSHQWFGPAEGFAIVEWVN